MMNNHRHLAEEVGMLAVAESPEVGIQPMGILAVVTRAAMMKPTRTRRMLIPAVIFVKGWERFSGQSLDMFAWRGAIHVWCWFVFFVIVIAGVNFWRFVGGKWRNIQMIEAEEID